MSSIGPNFKHLMPRSDFADEITGATSQIKGIVAQSEGQVRNIIQISPGYVGVAVSDIGSGSIGAHALLEVDDNWTYPARGQNRAGSRLRWASTGGYNGGRPSGTWMCLGHTISGSSADKRTTLFKRVA